MGLFGNSKSEDGLLFKTGSALTWIKVYRDRVVFNEPLKMYGFLSSVTVPLIQISSVSTNVLLNQVIIETTGGKQYKVVTLKKSLVKQAIYDAQTHLAGTGTTQTSNADEITKLHELKEKGIISQEEFDQQKAKLLSTG